MTLKPVTSMTFKSVTSKSILTLAALALSGSLAFAQTPPAPADAAAPAAPVQRQPPPGGPGPGRGPQGRASGSDNRNSGGKSNYQGRSSYRGKPGDGFRGSRGDGMMMGSGFRIAPPGMWWKNASVVQKISLTPDQAKKMDDIFQQSRIQLIDLKANVEKQNVMLEPMLSANPPDTAKTLAQIDKIAQARAELEKANAKMLLGIRGVLTPDQWTKLRASGPGDRSDGQGGRGGPQGGGPAGGGGGYGRGRGPGGQGGAEDFVAPEPQP
jgi:Spy/CpxP family protein refolding chaperone